MGLFNFIKTVGEKLFDGDGEANAESLKKSLDSHQLGTDNVAVSVDGDTVNLKGEVKDQAAFEKAVLAVGNAEGIAKVNTDGLKVSAASVAEPVFYTVQQGDSLWKIAESQYGKGKGDKYNAIFEANVPLLKSPDKIYPGQVLRIPPLS